jgi:hypothetical protein
MLHWTLAKGPATDMAADRKGPYMNSIDPGGHHTPRGIGCLDRYNPTTPCWPGQCRCGCHRQPWSPSPAWPPPPIGLPPQPSPPQIWV